MKKLWKFIVDLFTPLPPDFWDMGIWGSGGYVGEHVDEEAENENKPEK